MNLILKYFWSIGAVAGLVNARISKKRLKKEFTEPDEATSTEIDRFIKWCNICFTVPYFLLQIFQLLGGYRNCFYLLQSDFSNVFYILGILTIALYWSLMVYLVVVKGGAELIAKYGQGFYNILNNPRTIKILVILMVIAGCIAFILRYFFFQDMLMQFSFLDF